MKLLIVTDANAWVRSIASVHHWSETGKALGHDVLVYGEPNPELPALRFTRDLSGIDLALILLQVPSDFPDMPHLARLLDGIPPERRVVADLWGHYNDTIRVDHDFNHLEKLDGHLGWEWEEAVQAAGSTVTQPALKPRRANVKPFLFHGFNPAAVVRNYKNASEAAAAWKAAAKPYGVVYVGSNWQRWSQMRAFLEGYGPARNEVGKACLIGWDWAERPEWAAQKGIAGVDTDPALLKSLGVETKNGVRFDEVMKQLNEGRFAPVIHRPLFRELGLVTNRTFETFYADTMPVLMLPEDFAVSIYGPAGARLIPKGSVADHLRAAWKEPEAYWNAVLKVREHLAQHHSYERRFDELRALAGAAR